MAEEGTEETAYITVNGGTDHYTSFSEAVENAKPDENGAITYTVHGKLSIAKIGDIEIAKEGTTSVKFVGDGNEAEICLSNPSGNGALFNTKITTVKELLFTNLTLSRLNPSYVGDYAQANEYFAAWLRNSGKDAVVKYTNCTFSQGVSNNWFGKTEIENCVFNSNGDYGVWQQCGKETTSITGETSIKGSTFNSCSLKTYSYGDKVNTNVESTVFKDLKEKPAVVSSAPGNINLNNISLENCKKGLLEEGWGDNYSKDAEHKQIIKVDGEVPVYAAESSANERYSDFSYAIERASSKNREELKLLSDVEINDVTYIRGNSIFTLDLNGYNITKEGQSGDIQNYNENKVILKDGVGNAFVGVDIWNNGKALEITGGTYTSDVSKYYPTGYKDTDGKIKPSNAVVQNTASALTTKIELVDLHKNLAAKNSEGEYKYDYNPANADKYVITAEAPKGNIKTAVDNVVKDLAAGQKYEAYDIRIIKNPDSENKEIDLKESQTVSMTLASPVAEDTNVTIKHIDDYGNLVSGEIDANVSEDRKTITFTAGSFSTYVLMYTPAAVADNDIAQEISAELRQTDAAGGPTDEYDLVIKSNDSSKVINEFLSSEWQFKITDDDGKEINSAVYEVEPAEYMKKVTKDAEGVITYELNLDRNASDAATGSEITIGKIKVAGRGKYNLSVVSGEVHTTKYSDNIVDDFVANASNTGNLTLPSSASTGELTAETGKLTINAAFNNEINDNKTDYQNMKLTISGGDLTAPIELKLGSDFVGDENTSLKWDNTEKQYTAVIDNQLTRNIAYNVQLEGAGYRTARYTVNMGSSDKILNFWNNVKDTADVIEVGSAASKAVTKNFLAGDIVADNTINLYDLSAVVSYFGTTGLDANSHPEYAKYDLNRDGKIDSKDIAYVLVSWGE